VQGTSPSWTAISLLKDDVDGVLARYPTNNLKDLSRKLMTSNTSPELVAVSLKLATAIAEAAAEAGDQFEEVLDHAFGIVENLFSSHHPDGGCTV
jgi:hypothetical protein